MSSAPDSGVILVATFDRRTEAGDIPAGTRLKVIGFDERWDNGHASIFVYHDYTLTLEIVDGTSAGKRVSASRCELLFTTSDFEALHHFSYPDWLEPAPTQGEWSNDHRGMVTSRT